MIIVTGHLRVDPQDRDAFVTGSVDFVRGARTTPGCLDFAVSADPVDAGRVNVLERWESEETLKAFRGDGPDEGSAARILGMHVHDYPGHRRLTRPSSRKRILYGYKGRRVQVASNSAAIGATSSGVAASAVTTSIGRSPS